MMMMMRDAGAAATVGGGGHSPSGNQHFDVNRLTGLSPTSRMPSNYPVPSLPRNSGRLEDGGIGGFQWPEKIHGSTVKQQDNFWLQKQQQQQQQEHLYYQSQPTRSHPVSFHGYHEFCGRNEQCPSSTLTSATSSDSDHQYRFEGSDYVPARIPPSPAP